MNHAPPHPSQSRPREPPHPSPSKQAVQTRCTTSQSRTPKRGVLGPGSCSRALGLPSGSTPTLRPRPPAAVARTLSQYRTARR
eukprot:3865913-Rhodomonas_salina.1